MNQSTTSPGADAPSVPAETDFNLTIPVAIHSQPGLTLVEKAALAFIHKHPGCSNHGLAKLLGFKIRGVEALLKRLRAQGLIVQHGQGRARTHRLTFEVEPRTQRGNSKAVESHAQRGVQTALDSLQATYDSIVLQRHMARTCIQFGEYEHALAHMTEIDECIRKQHLLSPGEREKIAALFNSEKTIARALKATAPRLKLMPRREQERTVLALCNASHHTLVRIQQGLDAPGALDEPSELLALPFPT
jgi:hypothetical protein